MKKAHGLRGLTVLALLFCGTPSHAQDAQPAKPSRTDLTNCIAAAPKEPAAARSDAVRKCINQYSAAPGSFPPSKLTTGPQPGQTPIMFIKGNAAMGQMVLMGGSLSLELHKHEDYRQAYSDIQHIRAELDDGIEPAVRSAKGKPDLIRAIKDYYAAASIFFETGIPTNGMEKVVSNRLEVDLNAKGKALDLEQKLAGVK